MNPDFLNLKAAAEEAEFEEVPAGTFDEAQYEANRSSDLIMSQKHHDYISTEAEQEQTPFDRIRGMMRRGNTRTIKSTALEAKRAAKRKAQRKARRAAR